MEPRQRRGTGFDRPGDAWVVDGPEDHIILGLTFIEAALTPILTNLDASSPFHPFT
jgi:hypothetical protein